MMCNWPGLSRVGQSLRADTLGPGRPWGRALDIQIVELGVGSWKEVGQPILLRNLGDKQQLISSHKKK